MKKWLMLAAGCLTALGTIAANYTSVDGQWSCQLTKNNQGEVTYAAIEQYLGAATDVVFPSKIDGITINQVGTGNGVFLKATREQISGVTISSGITVIADYAFRYCDSIAVLTLPEGLQSIGSSAFADILPSQQDKAPGTLYVTLPSTLISVNGNVFNNCDALREIVFTGALETGGVSMFNNADYLKSVTFSAGQTYIAASMFYGCGSLLSVNLPSSIDTIGDSAFHRCSGLTSVYFKGRPASAVGADIFKYVNDNCKGYYAQRYATEWAEVLSDTEGGNYWNLLPMYASAMPLAKPNGVGGSVQGIFEVGQKGTITAVPDEGFTFVGWSGDATTAAESVTMTPNADTEVLANFIPTTLAQHLMESGVDAALVAKRVYTKESMKEMAFGNPLIEVMQDKVSVAISLETTENLGQPFEGLDLDGATLEKDASEKGTFRVRVPVKSNAAFYKFVVKEK